MAHGHFFRRNFGVHVDKNSITVQAQAALLKLAVDGREGIIEHWLNHHAAHAIDH